MVLATLFLITGISFATGIQPLNGPPTVACAAPFGVWVKITINFHRPKFDCLRGFGICLDWQAGIESSGNPNEVGGCPVRMKLENDKLVMQVSEAELSRYENGSSLHFFEGKTSITLEDDTELPQEITRDLGSSTPVVIKAGSYPVSFRDGIYTVTFQL